MSKLTDKLSLALSLALEEIHHPGANRSAGVDIVAMCEALIAEATQRSDVSTMVADELAKRIAEHHVAS